MKSKVEQTLINTVWICVGVLVIILGVKQGIDIFSEEKPIQVSFNVTGISDNMNATTLTYLHFDCIKFCAKQFYDAPSARSSCFTECSKLGQEECGK